MRAPPERHRRWRPPGRRKVRNRPDGPGCGFVPRGRGSLDERQDRVFVEAPRAAQPSRIGDLCWRQDLRGSVFLQWSSLRPSLRRSRGGCWGAAPPKATTTPRWAPCWPPLAVRGRAAFPRVGLDDQTFVKYLARVVKKDERTFSTILALPLEDLYLACACLEGCEKAAVAFATRYGDTIRDSIGRIVVGAEAEDIQEQLVLALLVGSACHATDAWELFGVRRGSSVGRRGCASCGAHLVASEPDGCAAPRCCRQTDLGRRRVTRKPRT